MALTLIMKSRHADVRSTGTPAEFFPLVTSRKSSPFITQKRQQNRKTQKKKIKQRRGGEQSWDDPSCHDGKRRARSAAAAAAARRLTWTGLEGTGANSFPNNGSIHTPQEGFEKTTERKSTHTISYERSRSRSRKRATKLFRNVDAIFW